MTLLNIRSRIGVYLTVILLAVSVSEQAMACACGCSVFDVGGQGLPQENDSGGRVFFDYYYANQSRNWAGSSRAPADINLDKRIETNWYAVGVQYTLNRDWGFSAKLPYAHRAFTTTDPDTLTVNTFNSTALGDLELIGTYTGLSKDLSTGISFGIKLPTGEYTAAGFDRDNQIGSGSTDLIIGGFHRGLITGDNAWQYFGVGRWLIPVDTRSAINSDNGQREGYTPGAQFDGAVGIVYNNGYKWLGLDKITPVLQLIGSHRDRDHGLAADPHNTGFDRLMIAPGIELTTVLDEAKRRVLKIYGEVEVPIYQNTNASPNDKGSVGQLVTPIQFKLSTSYNF